MLDNTEITAWRMVKQKNDAGPYDIALVEGSAQTKEEIELLKDLRQKTKYLIGLGACACIGGIPSIPGDKKEREKLFKIIYGKNYQPRAPESKPIDAYVPVDFYINGCPVHFPELERVITNLLYGRFPERLGYPVCLECKFRENECVLIKDKACLGPITQGGCDAICIAEGKYCYGCQGPFKTANMEAWQKRLREFIKDSEIKNYLNLFLSATKEFTLINLRTRRAKKSPFNRVKRINK
jgi:sulfhydrogenase subunit delta